MRLVLGGRTLTGSGSGDGVRAAGTGADPIAGLRVENGTVRGFFDGVELNNVPGARVVGVTATGNEDLGIFVGEAPGARVEGNTATGNGASGIEVAAGATGNRLEGNRATGNTAVDLEDENLPACVNTWRANCFATDNEGDGSAAGGIR